LLPPFRADILPQRALIFKYWAMGGTNTRDHLFRDLLISRGWTDGEEKLQRLLE